jgi:hypothetical protein
MVGIRDQVYHRVFDKNTSIFGILGGEKKED